MKTTKSAPRWSIRTSGPILSNEEIDVDREFIKRMQANYDEVMLFLRAVKPRDSTIGACRFFAQHIAHSCLMDLPSITPRSKHREAILTHAQAAATAVLQSHVSMGWLTLGDAEPAMVDAAMSAIAKWFNTRPASKQRSRG